MAKFYEQYRDVLEANGYTVDENGCVRDSMGNQAAAEDAYGNVQCKDPNVTELCRQAEAKPAKEKKQHQRKLNQHQSLKRKWKRLQYVLVTKRVTTSKMILIRQKRSLDN